MHDLMFQSLTRDSNHSNGGASCSGTGGGMFQSLTRDSNHSNARYRAVFLDESQVSIPHAG